MKKLIIRLLIPVIILFNACENDSINETCSDGIQNQEETGIDCGGPCTACASGGCGGITTMTDVDGNIYPVVEIGSQCWMKENLRVSAGIANVADNTEWANGNPAWCYFRNNPSYGPTYGKIYNWYAVNTGNLCPAGWHIPTHAEWTILIDFLGGDAVAGGLMKTTTRWKEPNEGATNSSGFSVLPSGSRNHAGLWGADSTHASFWTDPVLLSYRTFFNYTASVTGAGTGQTPLMGISCRCIKN